MSEGLVGTSVYNKRTGLMGTIVGEDGFTYMIDTQGEINTVTQKTLERWYTLIKEDQSEDEILGGEGQEEAETSEEPLPEVPEVLTSNTSSHIPTGERGIGMILATRFIKHVKDIATQNVDTPYSDESGKNFTIKYNGKNVFECSIANRRFNVMCHPNSLTPVNKRYAYREFPGNWGWSLRTKFVFTSLDQIPLMKSIIMDGLFYRQEKRGMAE